MAASDLVVRDGTVATAADVTRRDIGIREGRIVALGVDLGPVEDMMSPGLVPPSTSTHYRRSDA